MRAVNEAPSKKDDDDILFMFKCEPCNKRMALWQDGTEWEGYQARCQKCNAPVDETDTVKGNVITSTYTCPNCDYDYKNVWKLGAKTQDPSRSAL
jgi:C4-type Zn-finger protein